MIRKRMLWPLCISWLWNQILLPLCPRFKGVGQILRSKMACFRADHILIGWRASKILWSGADEGWKAPGGWLSGIELDRGFDRKLVKIRERWPCVFLSDKKQLLFLKLSQKTTLRAPLFLSMNNKLAKQHNLNKSGFLTVSTSPKRP